MVRGILEIDKELFSQYFYYDVDSPTGLSFRAQKARQGKRERVEGEFAGTLMYMKRNNTEIPHMIRVNYNGKLYAIHRIIWTLEVEDIPEGYIIDHIDGNPFNNRLTNLRCITVAENTRNAKLRVDNSTGYNGVSKISNGNGREYIYASYYDENKRIVGKCWSLFDYTEVHAIMLAAIWRANEIKQLAEKGIVYTGRHGT